jgi:hypothetical protein
MGIEVPGRLIGRTAARDEGAGDTIRRIRLRKAGTVLSGAQADLLPTGNRSA